MATQGPFDVDNWLEVWNLKWHNAGSWSTNNRRSYGELNTVFVHLSCSVNRQKCGNVFNWLILSGDTMIRMFWNWSQPCVRWRSWKSDPKHWQGRAAHHCLTLCHKMFQQNNAMLSFHHFSVIFGGSLFPKVKFGYLLHWLYHLYGQLTVRNHTGSGCRWNVSDLPYLT